MGHVRASPCSKVHGLFVAAQCLKKNPKGESIIVLIKGSKITIPRGRKVSGYLGIFLIHSVIKHNQRKWENMVPVNAGSYHSLCNWANNHRSQFSSVQSLSRVWLFATPWIAVSLSITNSRGSPRPMSFESVMPPSHLILCHPLLLLSPVPPSIRVFSNESTLHIRWPKYWSFSFSISPSNEHPGLISF